MPLPTHPDPHLLVGRRRRRRRKEKMKQITEVSDTIG